ncbi:MAG: TolC family protein, partial [Verrucomicrobia bacterium]
YFLDEQIRITRRNLRLLEELEAIARARNAAGQVTLQDVLRARIARDRVETDLANLEDSRQPKLTAFKAALGLLPDQPDPPLPRFASTPLEVDEQQLLRIAFENNPSLAALAEEIRAAEAAIALAYREKVPDFALGAMADVKNSPTLVRPLASMTLPIWRDKIAADIARAEAAKLAAQRRLESAQIELAVTLAQKAFAYREVSRNLALLQKKLIPQAALSVSVARAGYLTGDITFFNLVDAELQQLAFELGEVEARTRREVLLAEIALMVAGLPPAERPWSAPAVNSNRPLASR